MLACRTGREFGVENIFIINSLIIITILICKIPPNLPLPAWGRLRRPKGGITLLWQRGATCLREAASAKAGGRFSNDYVNSILRPLINSYGRVSE
jgi:hypothetical protein